MLKDRRWRVSERNSKGTLSCLAQAPGWQVVLLMGMGTQEGKKI